MFFFEYCGLLVYKYPHKLVLNEFVSTLGKQIIYPFCFVARWLGTDPFPSLRGICVVPHLPIIISKVLILELTDNAKCNSLQSLDFCYKAWFLKSPVSICLERLGWSFIKLSASQTL